MAGVRFKSESTVTQGERLHVSPESDVRIAVDRVEAGQEDSNTVSSLHHPPGINLSAIFLFPR